ncbi:alpha-N-acetylglucosaminidase [Neoasaia chiangmaiensis NBRC 101099]|nr:alpha-N-acetylglucosaminidase [Neoasaia chiangmaiensis NBRC 101099]GEN16692.1 alpha-N-acetylglucosaminidase [Neoasaia chiangmaiensis]
MPQNEQMSGPAYDVLSRSMPDWRDKITFSLLNDHDTHDHFSVRTENGKVVVAGNSQIALLAGSGWYMKYYGLDQLSSNGAPMPKNPSVVALDKEINKRSSVIYRYALNQNTDGYTSPYWNWRKWEHEIDIYALAGINTMLVERGAEAVISRTLMHFGYSSENVRTDLTMPAHMNWQLMGNMCCFAGPPSTHLLEKRIESAQQILRRLRELGITPVLPGFYGMVPADFKKHFPKAHVINQGRWNDFQRPAWLDPRDPLFPKIAATYYAEQRALFGDTSIYDLELFQEGGTPGDVPIPDAAAEIEKALQAAHPGARWMILGWRNQPAAGILRVVPNDKMFIVDLRQNVIRSADRGRELLGADYLYGGLWEFGGRTTLGGEAYDYGVRLPSLPAKQPALIGTAIFTEAMDHNPYLFDLFSEAAWHNQPIDLRSWTKSFADRRYGAADSHVEAAWQDLLQTVYSTQATYSSDAGENAAPIDSLFNAQPSLDARSAFNGNQKVAGYSFKALQNAFETLLEAPAAFDSSTAYRYDVVDVGHQVLANTARILLPKIKAAYVSKDRMTFERDTKLWYDLMTLQDELLGTEYFFRVGHWLENTKQWADTPEEEKKLNYDARSILTNWGDRSASQAGGLHDYANKDWAGLTNDYYRHRWEIYFKSLDAALISGMPPRKIDWYAAGEEWNRNSAAYDPLPVGNSRTVALKVKDFLNSSRADDLRVSLGNR